MSAEYTYTEQKDAVIYYTDGNTPLPYFYVDSISIDRKSQLISSPIETGKKIFDNKVIEPTTLDVTGYVLAEDYKSLMTLLEAMYRNRNYEWCKVQTKNRLYENLCLQNMPEKQTSDKYDVVYITLHFQEMLITKGSSWNPVNASDGSTPNTGPKGADKVKSK